MKIIQKLEAYWQLSTTERLTAYVTEDVVTRYAIQDCGDPMISISKLFSDHKVKLAYHPPKDVMGMPKDITLRKKAANLLLQASKLLPKEYYFKISEGFRPLKLQRQFFTDILTDMRKKYPTMTSGELWHETTKYVADPTLCPPHSTGGTVDITINDKNNKTLDMGIPINSIDEKSATFYHSIIDKYKRNRRLLFSILTYVGFVNLPTEWWHFSYGDQYWAIFHKKPYAIYDKIE